VLALADLVVLAHFTFVIFVIAGGFLVLRWPRLAWVHVPVALWGAAIALMGFVCPLTPLENWLRARGGGTTYGTGFIEHYVMPVLYPVALTRALQIGGGVFVVALNALLYWMAFGLARRPTRSWETRRGLRPPSDRS
jgi:hypothetical protein